MRLRPCSAPQTPYSWIWGRKGVGKGGEEMGETPPPRAKTLATALRVTSFYYRFVTVEGVNTCVSLNVERPRDLMEAFNIILAGLNDESVSKPFIIS